MFNPAPLATGLEQKFESMLTRIYPNAGGGAAMCPGRQFARLEILITVALLVSKFDIESLEWTFPDGRKSDRPGKPDESVTGSGVLRPDRDMKVRWTRLW